MIYHPIFERSDAHINDDSAIDGLVSDIRRLIKVIYLDSSTVGRQHGLTGAQSAVIARLVKKGPLSSTDLSRIMYVTPANITRIIDQLVEKNLVQRVRQENDRRVVLISLTGKGAALGQFMLDPIEKRLVSIVSNLDEARVQLLTVAVRQILSIINADDKARIPWTDKNWPLQASPTNAHPNHLKEK